MLATRGAVVFLGRSAFKTGLWTFTGPEVSLAGHKLRFCKKCNGMRQKGWGRLIGKGLRPALPVSVCTQWVSHSSHSRDCHLRPGAAPEAVEGGHGYLDCSA